MAALPYRSAIEDSTFSPEIKAKVAAWHVRGAELIAQLDALLSRRQGVDVNFERADTRLAEARAILAALRAALDEVVDFRDPLGASVRYAQAKLRPSAAAEAVRDLKETEIAAIRALKYNPPTNVRSVVCCACSLLRLASSQRTEPSDSASPLLATWEEAQALLASPELRPALRSFDPHRLHSGTGPAVAAAVRNALATLPRASSTRQASVRAAAHGHMAMRMAAGSATTVLQLTSLQAAVRSGGAAIGALFLWCARVLSESQALKEAETLEQAQQAEENGLADALARAKKHLDAFEEQLRRQREGPCDGHVCE
jgi:hypothetical protein